MTSKAFFERLFSNWIAKLLSIAAAVVLFLFQRVGSFEERFFSIPLTYYAGSSHVVTDISVGSVRIIMRGPQEEIFNVLEDDIEAYIDLVDHDSEGIFRSPVLLRKTGSAETVDVEMRVDPLVATVTIESRITKELAVSTQLSGYPTTGYELVQTLTTPDVIEISGPRSRVEPIDRLQTTPVELTGRNEDFTIRVAVQVDDEMIEMAGSSIVEVHGIIRPIVVDRSFEGVGLRYLDLPPDLVIGPSEPSGSLLLAGPQLAVESLRREDLSIDVDCSSVTVPGVYELAARPRVPSGIEAVSFKPGIVTVVVAAYEQPEGTQ